MKLKKKELIRWKLQLLWNQDALVLIATITLLQGILMMTRFLASITAVATGVTRAVRLLQASSAQVISFYDFNIQWEDGSVTTGWLKVNNTPSYQDSKPGNYSLQALDLNSLLDASFTHEGTSYGKLDITTLTLAHYAVSANSDYQLNLGNVFNFLSLGFGNWSVSASDYGADGSQSYLSDSGTKYNTELHVGTSQAVSVSIVERPAKAVPKSITLAELVGDEIAAA